MSLLNQEYYEQYRCPPLTVTFWLLYDPPTSCLVKTRAQPGIPEQIYCVGPRYWYCYLIKSTTTRRTYVGYTDNINTRLRKHNGEITGGAKATRIGRPWSLVAYVHGFLTKNEAMSFEWYMHHPKSIFKSKSNTSGRRYNSGNGLACRLDHLEMLLRYEGWRVKYPVKNTIISLFWHIDRQFEGLGPGVRQYHARQLNDHFNVSLQ